MADRGAGSLRPGPLVASRAGTPGGRPGVRVLDVADLDDDFCAEWQQLAVDAVERNCFFAPEILLAAVRHLPGAAGVRLLTVRQDSELVLLMPITRGRYRRIPIPVRTTWQHPFCFLGTPLVRADALDTAPRAALETLAGAGRPGWLALQSVDLDRPVARAFAAAARAISASWVEQDVWERPVVVKREAETYLEQTLSSRSAKTLRRLRRQLDREVGAVTTRDEARSDDPAAVPAAVEAFLELEAAGWKGAQGTAIASDPVHAAFWRDACRTLAAAGALELWQLRAGDTVAATQVHVRSGDTVFHLKTTYDEAVARTSPGVQLELDVLHAFHADPSLRELDPCTGNEPGNSLRLYPDRRRTGDALIGFSPAGRLAAAATPLAARTWRAATRRLAETKRGAARTHPPEERTPTP